MELFKLLSFVVIVTVVMSLTQAKISTRKSGKIRFLIPTALLVFDIGFFAITIYYRIMFSNTSSVVNKVVDKSGNLIGETKVDISVISWQDLILTFIIFLVPVVVCFVLDYVIHNKSLKKLTID